MASQNSAKNKSTDPAERRCEDRPGRRDRKAKGIVAKMVRIAATSAGMYADCNYSVSLVGIFISSFQIFTHESGLVNIDCIGRKSKNQNSQQKLH